MKKSQNHYSLTYFFAIISCLITVILITGCADPLNDRALANTQTTPETTINTDDQTATRAPQNANDLASGYTCVKLALNLGDISLALDNNNAPQSVSNFLGYTNERLYDDTIFHRVIDGFMIQGGGFNESFSKISTKAPIANEANNGLKNIRGTISMARTSDPHSATSQFFINTVDNSFLNFSNETSRGWGYAVFGYVMSGMDVVDQISQLKTGASGPFSKDVPINTGMATLSRT